MRGAVKRVFCVFLSTLLVCQLCSGCAPNEPERTVKQFCKALQTMNFEAMVPLISESNSELMESLNNLMDMLSDEYQIVELFRLCAKKIRFKVTSTSVLGGAATEISVQFSYPDLFGIIKDYLETYNLSLSDVLIRTLADAINYLTSLILGGASEAQVSQITATPDITDWIITKLRKRQYTSVNITITFQCTRVDNNLWRIASVPLHSLLQILTFNVTH